MEGGDVARKRRAATRVVLKSATRVPRQNAPCSCRRQVPDRCQGVRFALVDSVIHHDSPPQWRDMQRQGQCVHPYR